MIKFYRSYQKIKRYGEDTLGINDGVSYVFPKVDGTNASVWYDGVEIQAGSRRRHLDESSNGDNAGFCKWARANQNLKNFFLKHGDLRVYGEWLVPHTIKDYREDAWKEFYVFDVIKELNTEEEGDFIYLSYDAYKPLLEEFGIKYINPIGILKNASPDKYAHYLESNTFLMRDGKGPGEGIVIKNYDYKNSHGNIVCGKIVRNEFKERHYQLMGAPEVEQTFLEEKIANTYLTEALIEKEYAKIVHECGGWESKYIPRLLTTCYYCVVSEEMWGIVKDLKNPTINFKALASFCTRRVKEVKSNLF